MTAHGSTGAAMRLRAALEQMADALRSPDVDALLACEAAIESAATELLRIGAVAPQERASMRAQLEGVRAALTDCRRLGGALTTFVRVSLDAQGIGGAYGRSLPAFAGQTVDQRI